jgi:hypothetical protein
MFLKKTVFYILFCDKIGSFLCTITKPESQWGKPENAPKSCAIGFGGNYNKPYLAGLPVRTLMTCPVRQKDVGNGAQASLSLFRYFANSR